MKRRDFLEKSALAAAAIRLNSPLRYASPPVKISLAQWSLHRHFFDEDLDARDFASIARDSYSIEAVEYVNAFYTEWGENEKFWAEMKERADKAGVKSLLIMVDDEGDLGDPDATRRSQAVKNHYKWIHAAKILGCHSIRVNAFGEGSKVALRENLIDGLGELTAYASGMDLNILVENHGLHTSDAGFITQIIRQVDHPNLGTLPDFGNWCLSAKWGSTQIPCEQMYDPYQGVKEMMPFAKGVSAKSYDFNNQGDETRIDYYQMMKIVKDAGFNGYVGIEYEGEKLGEPEGILATKALIRKSYG